MGLLIDMVGEILKFQNEKNFYTIGSGFGVARDNQNAFDRALFMAGCANYNLIKVSSILPAGAQFVAKIDYKEGALLPVAIAKIIYEPVQRELTLAAAVAIGIPEDKSKCGVIMEWSGIATEKYAQKKVLDMVKTAMGDRGIKNYSIKVANAEVAGSNSEFVCAVAYVALF